MGAVGPLGIPVVGRCQRGTWGCPGILNQRRQLTLSISHRPAEPWHTQFIQVALAPRVPGSASDPTRLSLFPPAPPPPHLSVAQSKERRLRRDYATASAKGRPTPCRQPEDRRP